MYASMVMNLPLSRVYHHANGFSVAGRPGWLIKKEEWLRQIATLFYIVDERNRQLVIKTFIALEWNHHVPNIHDLGI